jgi:hypothetical protein
MNIRNISQTVQEREIVKTAPDIVVYLDGLPYLLNYYIDDPNTQAQYSIVNFNDFVTAFNASYDTDIMIPNATIGLQVPNYLKHLFMMPGGNNLIQTMMEIQVFSKGYYLANNGDTVYRRVFKGVVSHIGYNDNGKTLEISVQCFGTLHLLELMQVNLNPSIQTSVAAGVDATIAASIFGDNNPYEIIAAMLTYGLNTAIFQQTNLAQATPAMQSNEYYTAVRHGYIAKWQAILNNVTKDIHLYGVSYKDHPDNSKTQPSQVLGEGGKESAAARNVYMSTQNTDEKFKDLYYGKIRDFHPDSTITGPKLVNNKIVSRMEYIRKMIQTISFEGYQDIDGKIIIKPPLYNLDVTNLGPRNLSTSPAPGDPYSSASNPLTEINDQTNPFIVYLSEILTENETEDQAAIRKTRTVVVGSPMPSFQFAYPNEILGTAAWVDVPKLQKFGLREEPTLEVPWIQSEDKLTLFAHAICETVRANRGYRTYTVTIPLRPELKLGFPIYFPHKDMYGYIKSVNVAYQIGGTATMTVVCDSIRRQVLIPQSAVSTTNVSDKHGVVPAAPYTRYVSAKNMVFQYTKVNFLNPITSPDPNQSPGNNLKEFQRFYAAAAQGNDATGSGTQNNNPTQIVGQSATLSSRTDLQPSTHDNILQTQRSKRMASSWTVQPDTIGASYLMVPDNSSQHGTVKPADALTTFDVHSESGFFDHARSVDNSYFADLQTGTIPFTDEKGYELLSPFPWGRWQNLRASVKEFTEDGYITHPTSVSGLPTTNQQDISVLNATEAFLFAGLGTPTATAHPANQLIVALAQLQDQSDTDTVIVLDYSKSQSPNDKQLLDVAQPDIQNLAANGALNDSIPTQQQLIAVLISGQVAPKVAIRATEEQLASPMLGTGSTLTPFQVGQSAISGLKQLSQTARTSLPKTLF